MNNFYFELQKIEHDFYKLTRDFGLEVDNHNSYLERLEQERPNITRSVVEFVEAGYSIRDAVALTAKKFDCCSDRVRQIHEYNKHARKAQLTYAKNYLIHKLKQKGFKMTDIAYILDCNKQTIYNYMKKDFIP